MLICFLEGPLSQTCLKSVEKLDSGNAFAGEVRGPHAPGEAERRGGLAPHSERLMPADGELPLNPDRNGFPGSDMRFRKRGRCSHHSSVSRMFVFISFNTGNLVFHHLWLSEPS